MAARLAEPNEGHARREIPLNDALFLAINAGAHPPALVLDAARLAAEWLVPATIALFVVLWIRCVGERRSALVTATAVMIIGLAVNLTIGALYFHPRPFMIDLGHQYLAHRRDGSFPSDHATFLWCLGFSLLVLGALRLWAIVITIAGFVVAWARVYLGLHFPFDMAGSFIISLVLCTIAPWLERKLAPRALPVGVGIYESLLAMFRLPAAIFPRETAALPLAERDDV